MGYVGKILVNPPLQLIANYRISYMTIISPLAKILILDEEPQMNTDGHR